MDVDNNIDSPASTEAGPTVVAEEEADPTDVDQNIDPPA